jgi:hypothetical protein
MLAIRRRVVELVLFRSLPLLVGSAAAIYLFLIRDRRWRVAHYASRARAVHLGVCLVLAAAAAGTLVYTLDDELACPRGYGDPDLTPTRSGSKGAVKIVCRSEDGHVVDGSLFALLFALLGAGALVFAGTSAILRGFGPPAPPPRPGQAPGVDAPTDKRDRRRERKRAAHRGRHD